MNQLSKLRFIFVWLIVVIVFIIIGMTLFKKNTIVIPKEPVASEPMNYSPSPLPDNHPWKE